MKQLFIDLETTGISPTKCAIWQIAAVAVIDGVEAKTFHATCRPFEGQSIEAEALKLAGKSIQEIESMAAPKLIQGAFTSFLSGFIDKFDPKDKFWFLAYNSPFDNQFLREFFDRAGDKFFGSWFWTPDLDIMRMAGQALAADRHLIPNFRLETVAKHLQIDIPEGVHDARIDIQLAMKVYDKIKNLHP